MIQLTLLPLTLQINQTGDLTNLSGLPEAERAVLPTLIALRDALYSPTFRSFVQAVTGCGPLSGIKTDMSCAEYSQGCYLLNHDDVIGTRRISFILYLVLDEPGWRPEWGGALELYPVKEGDGEGGRPNVPEAKPSVSIPVSRALRHRRAGGGRLCECEGRLADACGSLGSRSLRSTSLRSSPSSLGTRFTRSRRSSCTATARRAGWARACR